MIALCFLVQVKTRVDIIPEFEHFQAEYRKLEELKEIQIELLGGTDGPNTDIIENLHNLTKSYDEMIDILWKVTTEDKKRCVEYYKTYKTYTEDELQELEDILNQEL